MTTVESLEKKNINQFLQRWLGLPRTLSSIAPYGHSTKLQLPIHGLSEEFKVTQAREAMMYQDSSDVKVALVGIFIKTGRKWQEQEAVNRAEAWLQHNIVVGTVVVGQAGLGSFCRPCYEKNYRKKCLLVQDEI